MNIVQNRIIYHIIICILLLYEKFSKFYAEFQQTCQNTKSILHKRIIKKLKSFKE